ncbi:MAG TPA: carboxymuconolactone decarboxylase family protein [Chloroflexota bacterium]|nr:carboxymuconolactone decarboxylase family protein [Chloroflexota bacterium]
MHKPRLKNAAMIAPAAIEALQAFTAAVDDFGLPTATVDLVHLRASQINGCSVCTDLHSREAKNHGERDERLNTVAAWRDTPYFTDAERAALALAEAATRISDRADAVPDEIWNDAARHYDERELTALVVHIAAINAWNRLSVTTRQLAGEWTARYAQ